jgi:hypothetical protein
MNTRYFCSFDVDRISAPWMVWSKKPKISRAGEERSASQWVYKRPL